MSIIGIPLVPGGRKGGRPKSEAKLALREYQLGAAKAYKDAIRRRDGSSGPASEVRHIPVIEGETEKH
jgi:hypothetical protein